MRILFLILLACGVSGCNSLGLNNRYASTNPYGGVDRNSVNELTAKVQTLSIVSPAEEAELALAVLRARDLHAQLRAYDAAIAAAQQRQSKLKTRFPHVSSKPTRTKQFAFNTQRPIAIGNTPSRSISHKNEAAKTTTQLSTVKLPFAELTPSRGLRTSVSASVSAAPVSTMPKAVIASQTANQTANQSLALGARQIITDGFISKEHRFDIRNFVASTPTAQKPNSAAPIGRIGAL